MDFEKQILDQANKISEINDKLKLNQYTKRPKKNIDHNNNNNNYYNNHHHNLTHYQAIFEFCHLPK